MGKIVLSENVSPRASRTRGGDEGFGRGGVGRANRGAKTWPRRSDEGVGGRGLPRRSAASYQRLAAPAIPEWRVGGEGEQSAEVRHVPPPSKTPTGTTQSVLKGDVVEEVATLRQTLDGEIVVAGSFQLLRTLVEHDLVDELRLKIFPVVLGAGERLFGETSDKKPLRLVDTQTLGDGIALISYEVVRHA